MAKCVVWYVCPHRLVCPFSRWYIYRKQPETGQYGIIKYLFQYVWIQINRYVLNEVNNKGGSIQNVTGMGNVTLFVTSLTIYTITDKNNVGFAREVFIIVFISFNQIGCSKKSLLPKSDY